MKKTRFLIAVVALVLLAACAKKTRPDNNSVALSGHVSGTVAYRERIVLPLDARIIVSMEDVSRTDRGSSFVAQQVLRSKAQVPIPFDLRYLPSSIDRTHRYALRAEIVDVHDALLWTSTESYPVSFNEPEKPIAIMVARAPNPAAAAMPTVNAVVPFQCDDFAFIARFGADKVDIALPGRAVTLPQVISGSGARYSDGNTTFWNKGDNALFEMNGVSYKNCRADTLPAVK